MTAAGDPTGLWASAQVTALARGVEQWRVPEYGSPDWCRLPASDRAKAAAVIEAAELWRRRDEPDGPAEEQYVPVAIRLDRDAARFAYRAARPHRPAREVTATEGWPPVAVPGRRGWRRHYIDGRQVDLPARERPETAA